MHEKTLSKILHGQDLSYLTALKIKKWLKKSRKQVTFQNIESTLDAFELQKDCQKILASSLPLQVLAKQFGTTPEALVQKLNELNNERNELKRQYNEVRRQKSSIEKEKESANIRKS